MENTGYAQERMAGVIYGVRYDLDLPFQSLPLGTGLWLLPYGVEEGLGLDWGEGQKGKGGIPWDTPLFVRSLTMTYSHMAKRHTTIGDASFHF